MAYSSLKMTPRGIALLLLVLALAAVACQSAQMLPDINEVQVREAINAARYSGAEVKSPYEFHSAQIYFERAQVEANNGNHQSAQRYLRRAYEQAQIAYTNAKKFRKAATP